MTIIIGNLEQFTTESKLITYHRAFIKLYDERNYRQGYKIHGIIKFKK